MRNASLNDYQEWEFEGKYSEADELEFSEADDELEFSEFEHVPISEIEADIELEILEDIIYLTREDEDEDNLNEQGELDEWEDYEEEDEDDMKITAKIYPYQFKKFASKYRLKYIENELLNGIESQDDDNEQDGIMVNIIFPQNPLYEGTNSIDAYFESSKKPKGLNMLSYLIFNCDEYSLPLKINSIDELITWCKEKKLI